MSGFEPPSGSFRPCRRLADPNADVRKAAVLALTRHAGVEEARVALATATAAPDADVRAYAARGL
ncbi:hypothetical protein ABZ357_14745 [Streptomyces sp. NPDC005917]|uniref:hypothetical protein n=1 Tax=unclassified Streptomyces TaxID=2593676 RepID=UPI0033E24FAB